MPKRLTDIYPQDAALEALSAFGSAAKVPAPLMHFRKHKHPLEAALEEALGFTFYDSVLSGEEIARWEAFYKAEFVCPLRRICRAVWTDLVVIILSANSTGKTHLLGRIAAVFPLLFTAETNRKSDYAAVWVGTAPPEENLRNKIFAHINNVCQAHAELFRDYALSDLRLVHRANRLAGCRGQPFPQSGTVAQRIASWTGKHAPNQRIIGDEADGIPDIFHDAFDTCLAGENEGLILALNPKSPTGKIYEMVRRRRGTIIQISAFDTPNVITGENRIPGLVSRSDTVRDIWLRSRPLASDEERDRRAFQVPSFLGGATARAPSGEMCGPLKAHQWRVSESDYLDYKVLGRYPGGSSRRLVTDDELDAARARWDAFAARRGERPRGSRPVAGLDVSEGGAKSDWNKLVFRWGDFLGLSERIKGINNVQAGLWANLRSRNMQARRLFVDDIGVGQGAINSARDGGLYSSEEIVVRGLRGKVTGVRSSERANTRTEEGLFYSRREELLWLFARWIKAGGCLPPNELLLEELRTLEIWQHATTGRIHITDKDAIKSIIKRSPDDLDAAMVTFGGEHKGPPGRIETHGRREIYTHLEGF